MTYGMEVVSELVVFILCVVSFASAEKSVYLWKSAEIPGLTNITGIMVHGGEILLYARNALVGIRTDTWVLQQHEIQGFDPRRIVSGVNSNSLLFVSDNLHCIQEVNLETTLISQFSGSCSESGFVDGDRLKARFNTPVDLHRLGSYFYIADKLNDCLRKMNAIGAVNVAMTIHALPHAVGGDLFVAAQEILYDVSLSKHTYTTFARGLEAIKLTQCENESLAILTTAGCVQLLPLSQDISTAPSTLNGPFSTLECFLTELILMNTTLPPSGESTLTGALLTMHLYKIKQENIQAIYMDSDDSNRTATVNDSNTHRTNPVTDIITKSSSMQPSSNPSLIIAETISDAVTVGITQEETIASAASSQEETHSKVPEPLHNHNHPVFSHMPEALMGTDWKVILPTALAGVTICSIFVALAFIARKKCLFRSLHAHEVTIQSAMLSHARPDIMGQTQLLIPESEES